MLVLVLTSSCAVTGEPGLLTQVPVQLQLLCEADVRTASACAGSPGIAAYDEKNIRRRVYDALNVLMAMDIIIKDKKDISWKGLPSAPHAQLEKLKEERDALRQKILNQQAYLQVTDLTLAGSRSSDMGVLCPGIRDQQTQLQLSTLARRTVCWPHEQKSSILHQKPLQQQACLQLSIFRP